MTHLTCKLATALLLIVPMAACSHEDATRAADSAQNAANATGDKLVEMKDKFVAATQKEMDELSVKYDELKTKVASASQDAKAGLQSTLDDVKSKKDELTREFEESKAAHNGSSLEAAKAKLKEGMADLRKRIDDALDSTKK
jgi:FtsZ-binding cell division protein ZapB